MNKYYCRFTNKQILAHEWFKVELDRLIGNTHNWDDYRTIGTMVQSASNGNRWPVRANVSGWGYSPNSAPWVLDWCQLSHACLHPRANSFNLIATLECCIEFWLLTDYTCILKAHVFMQRKYHKVVFKMKLPDWLFQYHNG